MSIRLVSVLRSFALSSLCVALTFGCKSTSKASSVSEPATTAATPAKPSDTQAKSSKPGVKGFGAPIQAAPVSPLADVLSNPDRYKDKPVTVEGHVRRACSKKGCWMELSERAEGKSPACRISFKDYGFFVPTDSAGSKAKVQGQIQLATVKAAHVDHLEQEGATFAAKNPDGTAEEVRLVADGVELWR